MCGIAGAFQQPDGKVVVTTMTDRLGHRGPDASGVLELVAPDSAVVLGHRRLSIIDLSQAADQPLSKDGLTLTYNGEIYNHDQLRRELQGRGVRFATRSDTEVVLEAWRAWGPASLRRLRGMFAFAIHDERTGSLVLARDPLGIKPLYVMARGEGILFASELKAILAAVGSELTVNSAAMVASALYYWLPQEYDAVQQVRKLDPGTWAQYHRDGTVTSGTYWHAAEEAAARDRAAPRRGADAAAHRRRARRADRRPGCDQHGAHVRGGAWPGCEGAALRHGRGRAVRGVPQALCDAPGRSLPPRAGGAPLRTGQASRAVAPRLRRGPGPAHGEVGAAVRHLRRDARAGGLPAQL